MSELLSHLLTHLVLGFAALASSLTAAEPAPEEAVRHPRSALVVTVHDEHAELVDGRRGCTALAAGSCDAARMRWQITLAGPSLRRCAPGGCGTS